MNTWRRSATDVERTHRELRAGFADGLRGDDADGFAELDQRAGREIAAVAMHADAVLAFAGEHRADLDLFDARACRSPCALISSISSFALTRYSFGFVGSTMSSQREAADEAFAELDDFVFAFVDGLDPDAVGRAAIFFADDHVLRHIHQLAGHVTGVGGLERGIGQTFAGAVRRDEVFEHGQAFAEVRENRFLDDVAGRLGHQAAHTGELAHLLAIAARAGIHHQRDRVVFLLALVVLEGAQHDVRDLVGAMRPDIDDLVVAFARQ